MLPFVPRKVAKSLKAKATPTPAAGPSRPQPSDASPSTAQQVNAVNRASTSSSQKGKQKEVPTAGNIWYSEQDYATLLRLHASDYALWCDADLRRTVVQGDEGFIPLSHLTSRALLSNGIKPPPETLLVKSLRAHAADAFDVRMLMTAPSRGIWGDGDSDVPGGYEVRLKDWRDALHRARNSAREEWEMRTIYMENIPVQHRTLAGIVNFTVKLLPGNSSDTLRVQHVALPRHHLDKPNDHPKCKGFALVTLSQMEDVDHLIQLWPWQRKSRSATHGEEKAAAEPEKFGFRLTRKSHWEKLNAEYLAYRQRLLQDIKPDEEDDAPPAAGQPSTAGEDMSAVADRPGKHDIDPSADYPPNCLVFVRHVHPETNKTTLRKLLSQAFSGDDPEASADGIDYVDFNKSMDTCYLRLAGSGFTQRLIDYFVENPRVQKEGLDSCGSDNGGGKPIAIEAVTGEREGLYWGKVPEKVRRQAVEKAVKSELPSATNEGTTNHDADDTQPKRKRRRR